MAYTTINKSSDFFNTLLYTGNATDNRAITGVNFQPDFTWIKQRNSNSPDHLLQDAVRGATYQLYSNETSAQVNTTNQVKSFNADGFTIGTGTWINDNSDTYVSWNWKAGGGQGSSNTAGSINTTYTSVNTTAGFSISSYTGTGSNATVGHGLGAEPTMMMIKKLSGTSDWCVYYKEGLGNTRACQLNTTNNYSTSSSYFNNTTPSSTVFSIGTADDVNGSGGTYVAYCFAPKTGYSKFETYLGNGSVDGTFVYTGFRPAFIMIKDYYGDTDNWALFDNKRNGANGGTAIGNYRLNPNTSDPDQTSETIDFLSNGFKLKRITNLTNESGVGYTYMAFGQSLVGSNNIPCTAR